MKMCGAAADQGACSYINWRSAHCHGKQAASGPCLSWLTVSRCSRPGSGRCGWGPCGGPLISQAPACTKRQGEYAFQFNCSNATARPSLDDEAAVALFRPDGTCGLVILFSPLLMQAPKQPQPGATGPSPPPAAYASVYMRSEGSSRPSQLGTATGGSSSRMQGFWLSGGSNQNSHPSTTAEEVSYEVPQAELESC